VNRRVSYRFAGVDLELDLSLGLFSSAGVDAGSRLLLKTLAKECPLDSPGRILDVGCGVGSLGLALAARSPASEVTLVDRDELAVAFTRRNAALNGLENTVVAGRLMLEGPHSSPYDLIVSNFPAKAGEPVLADYLAGSMDRLAPDGRAALVIVHTLADRCRELLDEVGAAVLHRESSKQHTVYHYRPKDGMSRTDSVDLDADEASEDALLAPYIRRSGEFKLHRTRYRAETVWNIPDFDTLSWRLDLIGGLLDRLPRSGSLMFWNPGQGHLPTAIAGRRGAGPTRIILAGRDRLELLISRRNTANAASGAPVDIEAAADPAFLNDRLEPGTVDLLVSDLHPVPRTDWSRSLKDLADRVVRNGGEWALVGRSSDAATLLKTTRGWSPGPDRRTRGWRAAILRKN